MARKPPSFDIAVQEEWSTKESLTPAFAPRHQQKVVRLITDELSSNGVQWSGWSETSAAGSSKSTDVVTVGSTYTIGWAGLEGFYLDELEAGLTAQFMSTKGTSGTTVGFRWEYKDDSENSWAALSTWRTFKAGTSTAVSRTLSGYAPLTTGYNKLPLEVRLRLYKKASADGKAKGRIKNSSYVAIKVKKTA